MEEPTSDKIVRGEIFEVILNLTLENKEECQNEGQGGGEASRLRSENDICKGPEVGQNLILKN